MLTVRTSCTTFASVLILAVAAAPGFAAPIFVSNASFETLDVGGLPFGGCGAGCAYSAGAIPDWSIAGGGGQFQPGNPANTLYFTSLSDGPTNAYSNGGTISQVVGPTVQLGVVYTLLVDIGYRLEQSFAGTADLRINGITYSATGVTPVRGTFGTFSATYTGLLADVGQAITIELQSSGTQGNFDNVRLDDSLSVGAVPEPASFLLIGPALLALKTLRRRRVN